MSGRTVHLKRASTPNRNPRKATPEAATITHWKADMAIRHVMAFKEAVLRFMLSMDWQRIRRIPKLDVLTAVLCFSMLLPLVRVIFTSYSTFQPIGLWVVAVLLAVAVGLSVQSVVEKLRNPDTTH